MTLYWVYQSNCRVTLFNLDHLELGRTCSFSIQYTGALEAIPMGRWGRMAPLNDFCAPFSCWYRQGIAIGASSIIPYYSYQKQRARSGPVYTACSARWTRGRLGNCHDNMVGRESWAVLERSAVLYPERSASSLDSIGSITKNSSTLEECFYWVAEKVISCRKTTSTSSWWQRWLEFRSNACVVWSKGGAATGPRGWARDLIEVFDSGIKGQLFDRSIASNSLIKPYPVSLLLRVFMIQFPQDLILSLYILNMMPFAWLKY